jgi:hypothetical protein
MPIGFRNLEWLNHNAQRAYPIAADTSRLDITGTFELPNDLIVELVLPVHWGLSVDTSKFFIKQIASYTTGFSLIVGYNAESGAINVATALVAKNIHTKNQVYNLGGIGDFADSSGLITVGSFAGLDQQPAGLFNFEYAATRLEVDAIRPHLRGVTSLQIQNGSELSKTMTGNIRIVSGTNTRITTTIEPGQDPVITINAISGEGLTEPCICSEDIPPIRTINGIPPDSEGNFQFTANDCLSIVTGDHSLEFKDECSQPCCGCVELEAITKALEAFGDKATTLENFLVGIESRVSQMDLVVLGSKLGDRGCNADCS